MVNIWEKKLAEIMREFSAEVGTLYKLGTDQMLYLIAHSKGFPPEFLAGIEVLPLNKGIAGTTAYTKTPILSKNLIEEPPKGTRPKARTIGIRGMISVPVLKGEEVIGVLGVGCVREREFTQQELDRLVKIAEKLAPELDKFQIENVN